jgi:hypothetical protein
MTKEQKKDFRRQIVIAITAQRSCIVISEDPYQTHLRRAANTEFVASIWKLATAIVNGESSAEDL